MYYIKQGERIFLVGKAARDCKIRQTKNGKTVASFSVRSGHDENGQNAFMEVTGWGELAQIIGDESVGVAKGDVVAVFGTLVKDTYKSTEEKEVLKINAEFVMDMTTQFQLAQMIVGSGDMEETAEETPFESASLDEEDMENSFFKQVEEAEGELPY